MSAERPEEMSQEELDDLGPSVSEPTEEEYAHWNGVDEILQAEGDNLGTEPLTSATGESDPRWAAFDAATDDEARIAALAQMTSAELAKRILASSRISLATRHASGIPDKATARQNVVDTANGHAARRSNYGNAPGSTTRLSPRMLSALLTLAKRYSFRISELAGGSHSQRSRHYVGTAVDIDILNGPPVNKNNRHVPGFMQAARKLGAIEVLGPGDAGHDTHTHFAWP